MQANKEMIWWIGVVEDRDDPEKIGRCRVRIFGYHSEDTNEIPTNALPWAVPVQPITSAAASGVGTTPLGLVTGSWVVGWFLDGSDAQQPVILGTIASKPKKNEETEKKQEQEEQDESVTDSDGAPVFNNQGQPIPIPTDNKDKTENFPPLGKNQVTSLRDYLGETLSQNNYSKVGENGELGKYQFSADSLVNLGLVKRPSGGQITPEILDNPSSWTGRFGVNSKEEFLKGRTLQDDLMLNSMESNYKAMSRLEKFTVKDEPGVVAGLISTAHVSGFGNADKLDIKTSEGSKNRNFFIGGSAAVDSERSEYYKTFKESENFLPRIRNSNYGEEQNSEELKKQEGFKDPNKKYPKSEYSDCEGGDVNKLAVGDKTHLLFKIKENKRIEKIPLANSKETWDEPETAYGGTYPNNHVIETECGHVIEIDSTPNSERIHLFHKTGTYIEIDVNGTQVRKVVGENYEVFDRNNFVYVKGAHNLTVEGKTRILVKDDAFIQVDGDTSLLTHGDSTIQTAGTTTITSKNMFISAEQNMDIVAGKNLTIQGNNVSLYSQGGTTKIKSDLNMYIQTGEAALLSIKGGLRTFIDAVGIVTIKTGSLPLIGFLTQALEAPKQKRPDKSEINVLERKKLDEENFLFDSDEPGTDDYIQNQQDKGKINPNITPEVPEDTGGQESTDEINKVTPIDTSSTDGYSYFPRSYQLSKNFKLGDMLVGNQGSALTAQKGLKEGEIVNNMRNLAVNSLDKIKDQYPDMVISSGFRKGSADSEHNVGAAADLVFPGRSSSEYKEIAEWVKSNVPHRQLLLEYRYGNNNKLEATWIHISLQTNKNGEIIPPNKPYKTATFVNHKPYAPEGLNKFINLY